MTVIEIVREISDRNGPEMGRPSSTARIEAHVICTQEMIRILALRIEQAYCRRYSSWKGLGMTPGVWESAAKRLMEASSDALELPIDPEFFVAIQRSTRVTPDPWSELTQTRSLARYRRSMKKIIGNLRRELTEEITRVECRLMRGVQLDKVLVTEGSRISPLSRYIICRRVGRLDLAVRYHLEAYRQHRSCPLYRLAARGLLPNHAYPATEPSVGPTPVDREIVAFSRN